jgi:hypothetical protein
MDEPASAPPLEGGAGEGAGEGAGAAGALNEAVLSAAAIADHFGFSPPSKGITYAQVFLIIAYYVGLDLGISLLIYIKNIKNNWPFYKCSANYMMFASVFGYDTETNFQQCIHSMQSSYMTVLMEPANYLMSGITSSIGGLSSSLNDVRQFMNNFRVNLTGSIQNIFGVFLNMLTQIQLMVIKIKDMMSKNIGIMTTMMYTLDTSLQTTQNMWAGPIGKTVRAI